MFPFSVVRSPSSAPERGIGIVDRARFAPERARVRYELFDQGNGLSAARAPGARTEPVVHEDHRSGSKIDARTGEHLRCAVPAPVMGIEAPGDELESQVLRHGLRLRSDNAPWRTPQPRAYIESMEVFQAIACVSLDLGVGELRMPDVLRAMQLHAVTGTDHTANKVRKTQCQGRDNEERRHGVRAVQHLQDPGGPDRVGPVVEGQEDTIFGPVPQPATTDSS